MRLIDDTTGHCYACGERLKPSSNHCPSCGRWARVGQTTWLIICGVLGVAAGVDAAVHGASPLGLLSSAVTVGVFTALLIRGISARPDVLSPPTNLDEALRDAHMGLIMLVAIGVPVYWRMEFTEPLWLQLLIMFVLFPIAFWVAFLLRGLVYVALPKLRRLHVDDPRCVSCRAAISPNAGYCGFCSAPQDDVEPPGRHARPS